MHCKLSSTILAATCAVTAPNAQDARLVGKVVTRDGSPVEGAQVVLRAHGWALRPELGDVHEARCVSGRNGRFRVRVHKRREYSAWAQLPGDSARFTEIAEGVIAGRPVTLRQEAFERGELHVLIKGHEAWQDVGPFRCRVLSAAQNFETRSVEADEDGSFRIPALPGRSFLFEVFDAQRNILAQVSFGQAAKQKEQPRQVRTLRIPNPIGVRIRTVRFEDDKKAIAGATVAFPVTHTHDVHCDVKQTRPRLLERPLGTTDENGELVTRIPATKHQLYNALLVRAAGRIVTGAQLTTFRGQKSFTKIEKKEDGSLDLFVRLKAGVSKTGRVLDADGKPVAKLALSAPLPAAMWFDESSATWRTYARQLVMTDEEGRFRIDPLMPNSALALFALPNTEQRARLLPASDNDLRTLPLLRFAAGAAAKAEDLGDLRVELRRVAIALEHRGRPIPYAKVLILEKKHDYHDFALDHVRTDRRGHAHVFIPRRTCQIVAWDEQSGYVIQDLPKSEDDERLPIELHAFRWVSGKVVDTDEKPVAGATIETYGSTSRGNTRNYAIAINASLRSACETDARGTFRYPFLPEPNWSTELLATIRIGDKLVRSARAPFHAADEDVRDLELQFGREIPQKRKDR